MGSEMCIRDRPVYDGSSEALFNVFPNPFSEEAVIMFTGEYEYQPCLLYTSDAADERSSVDLGGRRIIKKKNAERLDRSE